MKFDDIYGFFQSPPPLHLNQELAVCYILEVLLSGDSYGTELIGRLERESATYRLSDTVLYSAIKFLETSGTIAGYWKKVEGRGRPRRMYRIEPTWIDRAQELAYFWQQYARTHVTSDAIRPAYNDRELQVIS
jgi:DNA-binding PadR family transcriptional regulator